MSSGRQGARSVEFGRSVFGYRKAQVDAFLDSLPAGPTIHGAPAPAPTREDPSRHLSAALEAAERIRRDAERDARNIVLTANEAARTILASARRTHEEAERESNHLLAEVRHRTQELVQRALEFQQRLAGISETADLHSGATPTEVITAVEALADLRNDDSAARPPDDVDNEHHNGRLTAAGNGHSVIHHRRSG